MSKWAAKVAASTFSCVGEAADFVVYPAAGGAGTTYAGCAEVTRTARSQDDAGVWVDREATFILIPRLSGASKPAQGDIGAYDGGRRFTIGPVKQEAGVWVLESFAQ